MQGQGRMEVNPKAEGTAGRHFAAFFDGVNPVHQVMKGIP